MLARSACPAPRVSIARTVIGARIALLLGASLLAGCGPAEQAAPEQPTRPHLIMISIDTLRADHLACYGYERPTSPVLDALAEQSLLFEHYLAASPSTGPAHMTMFTGVLPRVHGIFNGRPALLSPRLPYLPHMLQEQGWNTVAFTDGGIVTEAYGFDRGYDVFESRYEPFEDKLASLQAWLQDAPDEPTFLFVHTYGVHAPYLPPDGHDLFTDEHFDGALRGIVTTLGGLRASGGLTDLEKTLKRFWSGIDRSDFSPEDIEYLKGLYDGCIHGIDAGLGRLFDDLDAKGWLDDAWLIVTSDHGEAFGEHGGFSHRQLHQEELWVPLLVRPPGGAAARRVQARVSALDLLPTLMELLELHGHPALQGRSLLPFDELGEDRRVLATGGGKKSDAVIDGDSKLIQRPERSFEYYDLAADPHEAHNLAEEGPDVPGAAALIGLLDDMRRDAAALEQRVGGPVLDVGELSPERLQELRALGYLK